MWKAGHTQKEIAKVLKRNKSTISKEIKKNGKFIYSKKGKWKNSNEYEAEHAQKRYQTRRTYSKYELKILPYSIFCFRKIKNIGTQ